MRDMKLRDIKMRHKNAAAKTRDMENARNTEYGKPKVQKRSDYEDAIRRIKKQTIYSATFTLYGFPYVLFPQYLPLHFCAAFTCSAFTSRALIQSNHRYGCNRTVCCMELSEYYAE